MLPADAGEPGDDAFGLLHLRDEVIEFEINPDRAYALSLRGIAREAALAYDAPFRDPARRDVPGANEAGYPVVVDDAAGCPVFVTRTVTGFDPAAPTPGWLSRRVQLAGMRPISLAVDVTNYVMLELGQPIHGYDGDKLAGPIRVRRATEGEHLRTLDGVDRTLSAEDLLITDDSGPIGLAGVMGGETTELSSTTTHVVIEAAHFDPVSVFRTQKRHKLPSEASKRFERGVDPELPPCAADRVAELLTRYGGGTVEPGVTHVGRPPKRPTIRMSYDLPARITGMDIDAATTVTNLEAVGIRLRKEDTVLTATPPPWRPDLTDPFDLVEEVARIVGYGRVPSVLPAAVPGRGLTREQRLRRRIGRTLAGAGCVEVVSFPFVGDAVFDAMGLPEDDPLRSTVRLANALSSEEPSYTTTLLPGLFKAAARNLGRGAAGVGLFETGTVAFPTDRGPAPIYGVDWRPTDDELAKLFEAIPEQPLHLAVVLAGERERSGWWGRGRDADWSDAIDIVRRLGAELGVDVTVESASRMPWHPGRCARVSVAGKEFGHAGELHPRVCQAFGLPPRTAAMEIDLDFLMRHARDVGPGAGALDVPRGQGGRGAGRRRLGERRGRGGRAARGRGRAARVAVALRRLHRRAGRAGKEVAGVRAALPRARPHAHRGGDQRRPRRRRRRGRGAHRSRPADLRAPGRSGDRVLDRLAEVGVDLPVATDPHVAVVGASPQPGVEGRGGAADHGVGGGARVRDDPDVVIVVLDLVAGIGALEASDLDPHRLVAVAQVDLDEVGQRGELAPRRGAAVHHVEDLVHAVGRELGVQRADLAGGLLGVETVDEGLVGLPSEREAHGLLRRPAPRLLGRVGLLEGADERRGVGVEGLEETVVRLGPVRLLGVGVGAEGPGADHGAPEPLDPGEVPQQVGGVPLGAAGDAGSGVAGGEHVAEAPRLVAQVTEVVRVVESGHAAT